MKSVVRRVAMLVGIYFILMGCQPPVDKSVTKSPETAPPAISYAWFEYQGNDEIFAQSLGDNEYQNPISAGFYPDPSITRKADDFYMVNSSFSYTPGVPILHSRDLVNWKLIGHVLTRASQLKLDSLRVSRGIFAPTLRYHDGVFYMITTAVDSGGNFIVTATDPAGPWSDPIWLPEIGGIDPDIFFDDNGKVYIAHNDAPDGEPLYQGHRAIRLWEFDLASKTVITSKDSGRVIVNGGVNIADQPVWIEGPHIYKINGWYYLTCAEGGTSVNHSQVVFRTKSLSEPFVPFENNPILTQRGLDPTRTKPITSTGHADFIQTPSGEWWSVFLAVRPYEDNYYNTGRETFLLPITWQNEWPVILPKGEEVPYRHSKPKVGVEVAKLTDSDTMTGNFTWREEFSSQDLSPHWSFLRGFERSWLTVENDKLYLQAAENDLSSLEQTAFLAHRQQHARFSASTSLTLPAESAISGGITAFQNSGFYYYFAVQKLKDNYRLFVQQVNKGESNLIADTVINGQAGQPIILSINGDQGTISFSYVLANTSAVALAQNADAKLLSTEVAGGFVGAMIGLHVRRETSELKVQVK
jgi:xylan 1,4-beta-xylosidase